MIDHNHRSKVFLHNIAIAAMTDIDASKAFTLNHEKDEAKNILTKYILAVEKYFLGFSEKLDDAGGHQQQKPIPIPPIYPTDIVQDGPVREDK